MFTAEPAPDISARPVSVAPVSSRTLADRLGVDVDPAAEFVVTGMSLASGSVQPGDLYAAVPGARCHGAEFASAAVSRGAVALLTDHEGAERCLQTGVSVFAVDSARRVLGDVAALIYGHPASRLTLIGVTGTQGKTTTTQLIAAGLRACGRRTAVIGTMGTWIGEHRVATALTTPEAPDLHAVFAVMVEHGVEVCAVEVSSHALVLGRVDAVCFDLAVFTNLGRDHLDFHADLDDYFAAKARLFTPQRSKRALINADDPYAARLTTAPAIPTRSFSVRDAATTQASSGVNVSSTTDWRADIKHSGPDGSSFEMSGPDGLSFSATVALAGAFNVANAACALAAIGEIGAEVESAARGIATEAQVRGRMERVDAGQSFSVLVDYAHKPDAVRAALTALRAITIGRLIVVLGAGGDRDRGKRRLMGAVAAELADLVIVTDDNPRGEIAVDIRQELLAGARSVPRQIEVIDIGDRAQAISHAVRSAQRGDAILIAGKGHEQGQQIGERVLAFDDRSVAFGVLRSLPLGGPP
ncbi:MAG: UDP-N-acetylmuramoyl-L-alanyl-D-glutamate--2,6-diaminopimelate ligase [Nocardioidaceae bacterium]